MKLPESKDIETSSIDDPLQLLQTEMEEVGRSLKEVTLMLEQSRVEVGKLTQRNAVVTAHLQQVQTQLEKTPVEDIRQAYSSAIDTQQRLFVMRGQLEKLQNDQSFMERNKKFFERLQAACNNTSGGGKGEKTGLASVEMMVTAQEAERQKLSRQMHDGPAQSLSNFILQTEIAMRLLDMDSNQARNELSSLKVSAMNSFQKIRNFIFELRPMMLDDLGIVPTIRRYADTFKEQTGTEISVTIAGNERRLESFVEVMVFRAMQELLGNAVHQNQATLVKILLDLDDTMVKLSVDDNGKGYDADSLDKEGNLGLKLIKERVEMLGGSFNIDSSPGMGSRLSCSIPLQK
jgi:two-component system sensor histidine kinase DegS